MDYTKTDDENESHISLNPALSRNAQKYRFVKQKILPIMGKKSAPRTMGGISE
ncbi:MAG: hypothetical protein IJT01_04830 [Selenomonadaceae bacterium]|nr:hypothetical protein [Selenomonadaceae bacterium]